MTFYLNNTNFLPTLRSRLVVCKGRNERTCPEFLQFFQVSLAVSTNWGLKLNFYLISENKYNKFDSFSKKTKKTGSFEAKTGGRKLNDP